METFNDWSVYNKLLIIHKHNKEKTELKLALF